MKNVLVFLLIFLLFVAGMIMLQIFLSKKENKWPGLVMPIIAFLFGLLYPLNMVAPSTGVTAGFVFQVILVWLLGNIPTIILLEFSMITPENEGLSGRKYFFLQSPRLRGVTEAFSGMRWRKTKRPRTAALPVNLW